MKSFPERQPSDRPAPGEAPGVLLFAGDYYGTLAAARCLGRRGCDVALADSTRLSRAAASRFVRRRFLAPTAESGPPLLEWLLHSREPLDGRVLFPASDELVYLFAEHRDALSKRYRLLVPPLDRINTALNKQHLHAACAEVGLRGPQTWFPADAAMLRQLAPPLTADVMLKPKTQVHSQHGLKGHRVARGDDLEAAFLRFMNANRYRTAFAERDPDACVPMIQEYHPAAAGSTYSVAGFSPGIAVPMPLRASRKLLQRPRGIGVGVCFERVEVWPALQERLGALCARLDYVGIFEAEFIERQGELLLIDFNPRPYGQMAFEDARGLPLAYLHYLAATGDTASLAAECDRARHAAEACTAFCQGSLLGMIRAGQAAARLRGRAEEPWAAWLDHHRGTLCDAVHARDDRGPQLVDLLGHVRDFIRHPRAFVRSLQR